MDRGVIVAPAVSADGAALVLPPGLGIEPTMMRHYLLYWDKIEYPTTSLFTLATTADDQYLIDAGVLQRTQMPLDNLPLGQSYDSMADAFQEIPIYAQIEAAQKLDESEPGQWTIAQNGSQLVLPPALSAEVNSLEIELYNVIPSPGPLVPYEDILRFKDRYRDELNAFRAYMDDVYQDIISAGDVPRAKNVAIERLEHAISDLNTVANQSWASSVAHSFKVELGLPTFAAGYAGMKFGAAFGFPVTFAGLGVLAGSIKLELCTARRAAGTPNDFAYLCRVNSELQHK